MMQPRRVSCELLSQEEDKILQQNDCNGKNYTIDPYVRAEERKAIPKSQCLECPRIFKRASGLHTHDIVIYRAWKISI